MAVKQGSKKKAGSTRRSAGARKKDRRIAELENRVADLENELRQYRENASSTDLVELKRAREALCVSEERYRSLIESTGDWVWETDQDFVLTYDSPKGREILGYEPDEVIDRTPFSLMPPDELERIKLIAWPIIARHEPIQRIENRLIKKDGSIAYIETTGIPIFDESGHFRGYRGVNHDITERKRAEEALRESEAKFRQMAENINSVFWISDMNSPTGLRYIFMSPAFERIFGIPVERIYADPPQWIKMIYPEDKERFIIAMKKRAAGDYFNIEVPDFRIVKPDGTLRWIRARLYPVKGTDGMVSRFVGIADDVTEQKRAEEALKKRETDLARAQRIAHLGSWDHDIGGGVLEHSAEIFRIFGISPEKLGNTLEPFIALIHDDDREHVRRFIEAMLSGAEPHNFDFRIVRPDGQVRIIHSDVEIDRDTSGKPARLHGTAQDITDLKRAEIELKEAKAQAELYLDLMGHDINNMHQIALGYLELARGMPPGVQHDEMMDKPIEVLQRSAQLIKNVRKLQKLHDGVFQSDLVDVCKVLLDVQQEYGAVPGKMVSLNLNGYAHCLVRANDLLHDLFANLVGNAIKHTGQLANIVIDLDVVKDDSGRYCRVMVEDDGPGIPDYFKSKIFNRLIKGTSKAKGMGLGLYLVKSLVESYGGLVWAEDRISGDHTKGARFVVMLPANEN